MAERREATLVARRSCVGVGQAATAGQSYLHQFFRERVRPIVEDALRQGNHGDWPLITLNLDFKTEEPQHLAAILVLLDKYRAWLTTAPRTSDGSKLEDLDVKPVLVLTGESDAQATAFYDHV